MAEETTQPKLIPKGAVPRGPLPNDRTAIVDDSANDQIKSAKSTAEQLRVTRESLNRQVTENQNLRARVKDLERLNSGAVQLQKELEEARAALNSLSDDESDEKISRRSRRFHLFAMMLQGAASKGELFGNQINEVAMKKVVRHYAGVAQVAEQQALEKGF